MVAEMAIVVGGRYFGLEGMPTPAEPEPGYSNTKELGVFFIRSTSSV
jgi:NADH-quinone oxidoreductase subunit J